MSSGFNPSTGYSSRKPQTAGNNWMNQLPLSFISSLIFCLRSSLSWQHSLFRFYAINRAVFFCLRVSLTSEKIIGDRFVDRTFPQMLYPGFDWKMIKVNGLFHPKRQERKSPKLLQESMWLSLCLIFCIGTTEKNYFKSYNYFLVIWHIFYANLYKCNSWCNTFQKHTY